MYAIFGRCFRPREHFAFALWSVLLHPIVMAILHRSHAMGCLTRDANESDARRRMYQRVPVHSVPSSCCRLCQDDMVV